MENRNTILGISRKKVNFVHRIMLIVILHSSLIAPSQNLIVDYINCKEPIRYSGSSVNDELKKSSASSSVALQGTSKPSESVLIKNEESESKTEYEYKTKNVLSYTLNSDIQNGIIGVSDVNPLDDAGDNLFKFYVKDLPATNTKIFLTYELFGVQDCNGVSRSVNDRPSTGGYIVKTQMGWTSQREEINPNWLKIGENKVMFGIPKEANYQYQIKNLKLEFDNQTTNSLASNLVVNTPRINYIKDNQFYVKGFLKNYNSDVKVYIEDTPLTIIDGEYEGFLKLTNAVKNRKFIMIKAIDSKGLLGQELISLDNLAQADQLFVPEKNFDKVVTLAKARSNVTLKADGVSLVIKENVLIEDKEISIAKLRNVDIAPMASGMINVTKGGYAHRFLPDGTKFAEPVKLTIEYDEKLIPKGHTANEIKTFYFDTNNKAWIAVKRDTINKVDKSIVSYTNHFTDYINGIIQTPESPETAGFTPTMMNDIKAADPSSEMTIISPPEVSQKGDANIGYSIKIPSGRKGMQPQLAIQYSNEGGNSWLGQGWNISVPSIAIDTRWGVPLFDPTNESEIYTLGGEQLMYPKIAGNDWMPNRHNDVAGAAAGTYTTQPVARVANMQFTPRKQGSFAKIERLGNATNNYYWKVTTTDGTVNWYGGKTGVESNAVIKNSKGDVVHWALYMTDDVFGNRITYTYDNRVLTGQSGQNENLNDGVIFHIQNIQYNGTKDAAGKYEVVFNPTTTIRQDVSINQRLGVKQIEPYFLDNILVRKTGATTPIRKYTLKTGYGTFGKGRLEAVTEWDKAGKEFYTHTFDYYDDITKPDKTVSYFADGVVQAICTNDNNNANLDEDNDGVSGQADACPTEAGPPSNNGCPKVIENCYSFNFEYDTLMEPGDVHGISIPTRNSEGTLSYIHIERHFASIDEVFLEIKKIYPSATYDNVTRILTITNITSQIREGDHFRINQGNDDDQDFYFHKCIEEYPPSESKGDFKNYFANVLQNNQFTLTNGVSLSGSCPKPITNSSFLISGYIPSFDSAASILGSSKTEAISGGFYIGIGIGGNRFTKMTTFGVQFNRGNDKSEGMTALIDINGDGLEDIVSKESKMLYYKKHIVTRTYDANNEPVITHSFEAKRPITGISNFYRSFGRSKSANFQITYGMKIGGFVGRDKSKSKSETDMYFTDGNGDGLMDIVRDGVVYFNRLDANKNPNFIPDSKGTENLVITAAPKTVEVPAEIEQDDIVLPAFDVVKVWEAPADGTIKIDNNITLTDPTKESVVTVEMSKTPVIPTKCYEVSFPVPQTTTTIHNYYSNITGLSGVSMCSPVTLIIDSFIVDNVTYTVPSPNKLYTSFYKDGTYINQCPNPLPTIYPSTIIQNTSFATDFGDWLKKIPLSSKILTSNVNIINGSNLDYILTSDNNMVYNTTANYAFYLKSTDDFVSSCNVRLTGNGISFNYYNFPTIKTQDEYITIGIPTTITVNGNPFQGNPYNLYDNFSQFQTAFQTKYSNSLVSLSDNVVTIRINNTTEIYNSIALTPTSGSAVKAYNFPEVSCNTLQRLSSENAKLIVAKQDDWKSYKPSKEELELSLKKWEADGKELVLPIDDNFSLNFMMDATNNSIDKSISSTYSLSKDSNKSEWKDSKGIIVTDNKILATLNQLLPSDIEKQYADLKERNKQEIIESRKKAQLDAQLWLNEYNRKQTKVNNKIAGSAVSRTINPTTCNETPSDLCLLYGKQLNAANSSVTNTLTTNCSGQPLNVKKGDRIYFRVHSVEKGNPPVDWNPKVEYTTAGLAAITDANGHTPFSSSYSDSFVLSGKQPTAFPGNSGTARISWSSFRVNKPSDNVTYQIIKRTFGASTESTTDNPLPQIGPDQIIYQTLCVRNTDTNVAPSAALDAIAVANNATTGNENLTQTFFYFKVISTSNVDWKNCVWKPKVEFTTDTPISPNTDGSSPEGTVKSTTTVYPVPDYDMYRLFPCGTTYAKKDISGINGGGVFNIQPTLSGIFSAGDNGKINFEIKKGNLFITKVFTVTNGVVTGDSSPISLSVTSASSSIPIIEIMFTVDDSETDGGTPSLLSKLAVTGSALATLSYGTTSMAIPKSEITLYQKTNPKFGGFFRQWGQFMYNPANVTGATPTGIAGTNLIKEEALEVKLDQSQANQLNTDLTNFSTIDQDTVTPEFLENFQTQHQDYLNSLAFLSANPSREIVNGLILDRWIGFHNENYSSELGFRAAKLEQSVINIEDSYSSIEQDVIKTGAYAISKFAKGNSKNFSAGVNFAMVGVNGSRANGGLSNSLSDYIDYNGDRYPDIVTTDKIQYTNKTGGLFSATANNGQDISTSTSDSKGFGASGSFSKSSDDSGDTSGDGSGFQRFDGFKGNSGAGFSGSFTKGNSVTQRVWTDINGDGLSDLLLTTNVMVGGVSTPITNVTLNSGPTTPNTTPNNWGTLPLFKSKSNGISGGLGVNKWNGSVEAGVSLTTSWNSSTNTLADINGDGLLDMIYTDDNLGVMLNLGNQFVDKGIWGPNYNLKKESASVAASLNAGFTFALIWRFWGITFKIPAVNINGTPISTSTNKTKKSITDFDGDGYVDLVEESAPNEVKVYYSRIRRTDMLKSVTNPLGGKFTIDYKVQTVDYNNPNAKWAMSDLVIEDKYDKVNDGEDVYKKHFIYENGRYDRRERDFYGYKTVKVEDYALGTSGTPTLYRTSVSNYLNQSYFLNGLLEDSYVIKGGDSDKKFSRTQNFYQIFKLNSTNNEIDQTTSLPLTYDVGGSEGRRSAAVLLTKTNTELYELDSSPQLTTEVLLKYDEKGRVVEYTNKGNVADANDDYKSTITYQTGLAALNIINIPKSIKVTTTAGGLVRERTTDVDTSNGSITKISANNSGKWAETTMKYDRYGNLNYIKYPANTAGEFMTYTYKYDSTYNKYITDITDAFGYKSTATYDSDLDKILTTIDLSGKKMIYKYDTFGRNTEIVGANETATGVGNTASSYTLKFEYYPYYSLLPSGSVNEDKFVPVAVTKHYDQQHKGNDIETYTFIDGLARPIQVKKDIYINTGSATAPVFVEGLSVSGKTAYDELGRAKQQFHPWWETKTNTSKFVLNEYSSPYSASTEYDELDRPIKSTDPEGNISTMQYSLDNDVDGVMAIKTKSDVDQNGLQHIITETYKDVAGKVISTKNQGGTSGSIWTKFRYNAIGELMTYTDTENISTTYEYDMFGRKKAVHHPDNGTTTFKYDDVNLVAVQTANLQVKSAFITYKYDRSRLIGIDYPNTPTGSPNVANVEYKYGASGGAANQKGRLIWQKDATGTQTFDYGNMGEITTNVRTIIAPNLPTRVFTTSFSYDSWNRLQTMKYPDGEVLTYSYDLGGNLTKMTGMANNQPKNYISRIDYDYFEQKTYMLYGNNTSTAYNYTPALRRLSNLNVKTASGNNLFNNNYQYDKVGNVLSLANTAGITTNNMGGVYSHNYTYDNLNRLSTASGSFTGSMTQIENGNDANSSYGLAMTYNNTHGIAHKSQVHNKNGNPFAENTYENGYQYSAGTHKVDKITDDSTSDEQYFIYDLNGNNTTIYKNYYDPDTEGYHKSYYWDESNRLRVAIDPDEIMHHYLYDASGERVLKASSDYEYMYQNGTLTSPASVSFNGYTTYPSAFMVITADGVFSKHYYAGSQRVVSRLGSATASLFETASCTTCKQANNSKKTSDTELKQAQIADLQQYVDAAQKGKISFKDYTPTPLETQEKTIADEAVTEKTTAKEASTNKTAASFVIEPIYYYHPDHLGTSTFLTDDNGVAYQFFLNLPYGETMAEQLGSHYYKTPYKFNGKELDEETGLYYYGARYYDPKTSIWLSVDPLAEDYPNVNPYNYCFSNPVNLVDPTGMGPDGPEGDSKNSKLTGSTNLVIFTMDNNTIDESKMNATSGKYDWIAVNNPEEAQKILKEKYGNKKAFIENLVWRSHGSGEGAELDADLESNRSTSDPSKSAALGYVKSLLTDDATVMFTACSLVGGSLQPDNRYYASAKKYADNFSSFFVGKSNRTLFLNYTLTNATTSDYSAFRFDAQMHNQKRGGFLQYTKNGVSAGFYDLKVNSSGGMSSKYLRPNNKFGVTPEAKKSFRD